MKNSEMVREFMEAVSQPVDVPYSKLPFALMKMRLDLIEEEYLELKEATYGDDLVGLLDGLADILYVTYGMAITLGLPIDEAFAEVHRSNMTKLDENGEPIFREDGKLLKGPNYEPPSLERFCEQD